MKRFLVLLLLAVPVINSCTIQVNTEHRKSSSKRVRVYVLVDGKGLKECSPYDGVDLPPMPPIPKIPDKALGNLKAEEDILVASIDEHRRSLKEVRRIATNAVDDYIDDCLQ